MIGKSDDTGELFNVRKIVKNKIRCKKCGDIIESVSVNDFKFCKCGAVAVDGGFDYLRIPLGYFQWTSWLKSPKTGDCETVRVVIQLPKHNLRIFYKIRFIMA